MEEYRINYLHRLIAEENKITNSMVFTNFFIVEFPEELQLRPFDVVSVDFLGDNMCRIVIRNNFDNCPLIKINEYIKKKWVPFKHRDDEIKIKYIDKSGLIRSISTLSGIKIKRVYEGILTYKSDGIQEISLDIVYNKRDIEMCNGSANQK